MRLFSLNWNSSICWSVGSIPSSKSVRCGSTSPAGPKRLCVMFDRTRRYAASLPSTLRLTWGRPLCSRLLMVLRTRPYCFSHVLPAASYQESSRFQLPHQPRPIPPTPILTRRAPTGKFKTPPTPILIRRAPQVNFKYKHSNLVQEPPPPPTHTHTYTLHIAFVHFDVCIALMMFDACACFEMIKCNGKLNAILV